jgi:hypothetical protein
LGPAIEGISAFAGFDLDELGDDGQPLGFGEARDGNALGFDPEAGSVLLPCGRHDNRRQQRPYKLHTTVCHLYEVETRAIELLSCRSEAKRA